MPNQLPKGWTKVKMGDIFKIERGGSPRPIEDYITEKSDGVNWIKIGDTKGVTKYIYSTKEKIKLSGISKSRMVYKDDFILSNSMSFGKPFIMKTEGCIHDGWLVIRKNENIDNDFLYYTLSSPIVFQQFSNLAKGSTVKNLNIEAVKQVEIRVPSLQIQLSIVAKIEELFSELDKGIENLRLAQQQLKTYRQAVLKWAFEGRLTNEGVREGELPHGWEWKKLKDIAKDISDGDHQAPPKSKIGIPFITISNINKNTNKIDFSDTFLVNRDYYSSLKLNRKPIKGDVLYTVTGSFGIPIIIDFEKEFCFQRHIGLIRPLEITNQKWLYYILQSPSVFNQSKSAATGTAQKTVALSSLRNFLVPFCQPEEQIKIVQELEKRLTVSNNIDEIITRSLMQAESLKQSILQSLFEGIPTKKNPNDKNRISKSLESSAAR